MDPVSILTAGELFVVPPQRKLQLYRETELNPPPNIVKLYPPVAGPSFGTMPFMADMKENITLEQTTDALKTTSKLVFIWQGFLEQPANLHIGVVQTE
jgi:hypothetical protein